VAIARQVVAAIVVVFAVVTLVLAVVIIIVFALVVVTALQVVAAVAIVVAVIAFVLAVVIVIVVALVVVALVALAAVAIFVAGGVLFATATLTVLVAFTWQRIARDVFELVPVLALALPVAVAIGLAVLTGCRDYVLRAGDPAGQQATDTRRRCRLQQPAPPRAGGTQLEQRIKRFAVHAGSPFGANREQIVIDSRRSLRCGDLRFPPSTPRTWEWITPALAPLHRYRNPQRPVPPWNERVRRAASANHQM
jgi:hypothetical protein